MSSQNPWTFEYTVAWISAIVKEYTIACALLDEEYDTPADVSGDYSAYTFGRVGQHLVVLACLPLANYGTSQAARLATEIRRTFPHIKIGLMVGIAGGAPLPGRDIRLGDVVVSEPDSRRRCGGVIHYTSGRTVQGTDFEPTSSLNTPDSILLSAAAKLKASHERRGHHIVERIDQVIQKHSPRLDGYRRPKQSIDVLYESSFKHIDERIHCHTVCQQSECHKVERAERQPDSHRPVIHYGLIGSADVLMRDAVLRDQIAQRDDVLCFEMESAGLMSSELKCLVIRGICDYSDTHKNDDWQKYAAAAAAAYAKELLEIVPKHQVRVEGQQLQIWQSLIPGRKPEILKVLRYDNMNDKHEYSTPGLSYDHQWIWSTSFYDWLSSSDEPYWICGKPGSGKSTLMAYLVHNKQTLTKLQENGTSFKILHFFYDCKAGSGLANSIHGMLRMFLFQLADQFQQIKERLQLLLDEKRLKLDTPDELLEVLCEALRIPDTRFCVFIDGLDEYQGSVVDLMHTCRLLKDLTGMKLCFGSRPEAQISEVFELYAKILMQDYNEASMYGYASNQLLKMSSVKPDIVTSFPIALQTKLIRRAEGILLWFKLAFDDVVNHYHAGITCEEMEDFVESIPQGLDAIYEDILKKIPHEHSHEAALLLFLVQQLRDLNQSIHDLSRNDQLSTIIFSATDMDHVWGAYDFMFELIGDTSELHRVSNQNALQSRVRFLLGGLIEVYEVKPQEALSSLTSNLDVRYVHKTLYSFVQNTEWMQENLHPWIKDRLPEPFWLSFLTEMIVQASKDQLLTQEQIGEAKNDTVALKGIMNTLGGQFGVYRSLTFGSISRFFTEYRSTLLGIIKAFGVYGPPGEPSVVEGLFDFLLDNFSSDYAFSPKWASRHVILRTAFLNLVDLARQYEGEDKSSFTFVHRALRSYLNVISAFHHLMANISPQQDLLISMIKKPELDGIWDLVIAIERGLYGYFEDRMFQELPATVQERDFLVHAVVVQIFGSVEQNTIGRFAQTLAANNCFLEISDVCFLLNNAPSSLSAAYYVMDLVVMIPPDAIHLTNQRCQCQHQSRDVGLLFHWAHFACSDRASVKSLEQSIVHHQVLLDFLLKFGIDINVGCYANGNVLHAILDDSVRPLSGRQQPQMKAKFIALTRRGINPRAVNEKGLNALESARALKARRSRWKIFPCFAPDLDELNFIIEHLEFYDTHERWPSDYDSESEASYDLGQDVDTPQWEMKLIDPQPELELDMCRLKTMNHAVEGSDEIHQEVEEDSKNNDHDYRDGKTDDADATSDEDCQSSSDDEFYDAEDILDTTDASRVQSCHEFDVQNATQAVVGNISGSHTSSSVLAVQSVPEPSTFATESNRSTASEEEIGAENILPSTAELEQIWDAQVSHFSTDSRLVPRSIREMLMPHEQDTWMFVFQGLQSLGLRMSPEIDSFITGVLRELGFKNVRRAQISMLEMCGKHDLLAKFYQMERDQFGPLFASGDLRDEKDVKQEQLDEKELRRDSEDEHRSRLSPQRQARLASSSGMVRSEEHDVSQVNLDKTLERRDDPTARPDLLDQPKAVPDDLAWGFQGVPQLTLDNPVEIPSSASTQIIEPPVLDLSLEPGMLAHRKLIDPCRRKNLKVDRQISVRSGASSGPSTPKQVPTASLKAARRAKFNAEKAHYDYVLLEDFRWTIIEYLGLGQEFMPSRRTAEQLLQEADWDFDRAVTQYVDSIKNEGTSEKISNPT